MKIGVVDVGGGLRGIYAAGVLDYCMDQKPVRYESRTSGTCDPYADFYYAKSKPANFKTVSTDFLSGKKSCPVPLDGGSGIHTARLELRCLCTVSEAAPTRLLLLCIPRPG